MAGDMEISLGFDSAAADAGARSFWDRQQAQIRAFNRYARPALIGVGAAVAVGTKAVLTAAEDSYAVKRQVEELGAAYHTMFSSIGKDIAEAGIVQWLTDTVKAVEAARRAVANFITKEAGGDPEELDRIRAIADEQDKRQKQIEANRKVDRDLKQREASARPDSLGSQLTIIGLQNLALKEQINTNRELLKTDRDKAISRADDLAMLQMQTAVMKEQERITQASLEMEDRVIAARERDERARQSVKDAIDAPAIAAERLYGEIEAQKKAWEIEKLRKAGQDQKADALEREVELRKKLDDVQFSRAPFADKAILEKQLRDLYEEKARAFGPQAKVGQLSTNFGAPYQQLTDNVLRLSPTQDVAQQTRTEILRANRDAVRLMQKIESNTAKRVTGVYA